MASIYIPSKHAVIKSNAATQSDIDDCKDKIKHLEKIMKANLWRKAKKK